jgi:hypothetical protein
VYCEKCGVNLHSPENLQSKDMPLDVEKQSGERDSSPWWIVIAGILTILGLALALVFAFLQRFSNLH